VAATGVTGPPDPPAPTDRPSRSQLLADRLGAVEQRLQIACWAAGRARHDLTLVAVSKTWPAADVAALAALGVRDFGENRDSEAAAKARELAGLGLVWHFVGQVQTNKARSVAAYADVVHSVDRQRLVEALSAGAVRAGRELDVLVQVSLDGDTRRGGVPPDEVAELAAAMDAAAGLRLRGVMAVAPVEAEPARAFADLAQVAGNLRARHPAATWISAGMSADLEAAVAAGATHVRLGTALFGGRPPLDR
jgi:pyridoxal phosphate enzyme (YggS family)